MTNEDRLCEYLDKRDAGTLVSLSISTLDAMRRDGRLPYHKVGKKVLFARRDLLAMVEANRIDARKVAS